jgi:hypothetical protein
LSPEKREEKGEQGKNRKKRGHNSMLIRPQEEHHKNKSHLKAF